MPVFGSLEEDELEEELDEKLLLVVESYDELDVEGDVFWDDPDVRKRWLPAPDVKLLNELAVFSNKLVYSKYGLAIRKK